MNENPSCECCTRFTHTCTRWPLAVAALRIMEAARRNQSRGRFVTTTRPDGHFRKNVWRTSQSSRIDEMHGRELELPVRNNITGRRITNEVSTNGAMNAAAAQAKQQAQATKTDVNSFEYHFICESDHTQIAPHQIHDEFASKHRVQITIVKNVQVCVRLRMIRMDTCKT